MTDGGGPQLDGLVGGVLILHVIVVIITIVAFLVFSTPMSMKRMIVKVTFRGGARWRYCFMVNSHNDNYNKKGDGDDGDDGDNDDDNDDDDKDHDDKDDANDKP